MFCLHVYCVCACWQSHIFLLNCDVCCSFPLPDMLGVFCFPDSVGLLELLLVRILDEDLEIVIVNAACGCCMICRGSYKIWWDGYNVSN